MKDNAVYLEVDEDITSAIDKLTKAPAGPVQIVVPKRSTMLQSIINLKLLKKAAEQGGKELVLVTNDRIATELGARVGLAVAPSVGAKPVIAEAEMPADLKSNEEIIDASDPEPQAPESEPKPVASKRLLLRRKPVTDDPPIPPVPSAPSVPALPEADTPDIELAAKSGKKPPKVPNFNRLQRRALWLGLAVALVGGYTIFMYLFTSAKVVLYANGTKVDIDTTFSVDPNLKTTDTAGGVLAGQLVTVSKDLSGTFTPTGQKDAGTKAGGTITISNCLDSSPHTFVSGTRFQAPDGKIFRSTSDVVVAGGSGSFFGCTTPGTVTVSVQADQNGDGYNEAAASYGIPGLQSSQTSGSALCPQCKITAKGDQMSGGTSKVVTVVTQSDVDGAKADILAKDKDNSTRDLKGKTPSGYTTIDSSQASSVSSITPAPAVDAEGSTGTLSLKVTYTVLAVKQGEYTSFIGAQELKQIGGNNQIYDDGLSSAQISANDAASSGRQSFHFTTEAYGGPKIDARAIAALVMGKRFGDASDIANRQPGVTRADISLWPSWSSNLPTRTGKINVTISVAANKQ